MTRRDIIILAVLINAGLLAILFMLAININDDSAAMDTTPSIVALKENEPYQESPEPSSLAMAEESGDEVDHALREFTATHSLQMPIVDEELFPYAVLENEDTASADFITPAPEVPTENQKNTKYVEVTVKKGDMLEKIARANNTTVSAIKEANNLKNERLNIGQVLRIPLSSSKKNDTAVAKNSRPAPVEKSTPSKTTARNDPQYYTIRNGDNPWKLAKQFGVKVDELLVLNNWNEEKARNLRVGDKIRIR